MEHRDAVADAHDDVHVVLDEEHGDAGVADPADEVHELDALGRVHAGRGLVEEEQLRLRGERPGDFEPPLVPVGEVLGDRSLVLETDEVKERKGLLPRGEFLVPRPRHAKRDRTRPAWCASHPCP